MTDILQHRAPATGYIHNAMDFAATGLGATRRIGLSLARTAATLPAAIGKAFAMAYAEPFQPSQRSNDPADPRNF